MGMDGYGMAMGYKYLAHERLSFVYNSVLLN